jgi:Domain of unknown function (DUF5122) beta-propeller
VLKCRSHIESAMRREQLWNNPMRNSLVILSIFLIACLARAQSCDPRWDTMQGGTNGSIDAMVRLPNGDIVVGGLFTQAGGAAANNVARWDGSSWHAMGEGVVGEAWHLRIRPNGNVLAMTPGQWVSSSQFAVRLYEWDGTAWTRIPLTIGGGYYSCSIANFFVLNDDSLVIFGTFWEVNGRGARNIARLSSGTWNQFGANADTFNADPSVLIQRNDGSLYAVGDFNFPYSSNLLEIEYASDQWRPSSGNTGWGAYAYAVDDDGTPYIGGSNLGIGSQRGALARLAHGATGPATIAATSSGNDAVSTLSKIGSGQFFVGGRFQQLGTASSRNIAMLDHDVLRSIGDGANGSVTSSLTLPDGQVVVAGSFTSIGSQPCGRIAKAWPLLDVEIARQPVDQAVAVGSTATFSLQAVQRGACPTPMTLQWQRRDRRIADPNAANAWINLVDDGNFVNTTQATFSILNPTAGLATGFRCRIQGCSCKNEIYSNEVNFSIACPADFNADGGVDFSDVEAFFERWENGC